MTVAAKIFGVLRWPAMAATWLAWGAVFGIVLAVTLPAAFGMRPLTVLTGSMRPAIEPGDMVIDEAVPASRIRGGDIVTFREPRGTRTITHRVRSVTISEGQVRVVTKGDANDAVERWQIAASSELGRVVYTVPMVGYPITWSHTPAGRLGLVSIPALLLAIWALLRIWRPKQQQAEAGEVAHATDA